MKYLFKTLNAWLFLTFIFAIYLAHCDSDYKVKCHKSSDFCAGMIVGEFQTELTEGYKTGMTQQGYKALQEEVETELASRTPKK